MAKLNFHRVLYIKAHLFARLHKRMLMYQWRYILERVNDCCVAAQPALQLS